MNIYFDLRTDTSMLVETSAHFKRKHKLEYVFVVSHFCRVKFDLRHHHHGLLQPLLITVH